MNRVKVPDGTATVSVEVMRVTKVGHWGISLRRLARDLGNASQETCSEIASRPAFGM